MESRGGGEEEEFRELPSFFICAFHDPNEHLGDVFYLVAGGETGDRGARCGGEGEGSGDEGERGGGAARHDEVVPTSRVDRPLYHVLMFGA